MGRLGQVWGAGVSLRLRCPAKVNLHLEVLGRRPDGYHELATLFAAVGLWDELEFEQASEGVLRLEVEPGGGVLADSENLVMIAARKLAVATSPSTGAAIRLRKRIPVGAGLGGGSADAAATLVGLSRLWGLAVSRDQLLELAASLGSDVPFFLLGGAAWGTGTGTTLIPMADLPAWWTVLLPGTTPVSTAEVYARLAVGSVDEHAVSEVYEYMSRGEAPPFGLCRNDLGPTVCRGWPEVEERLDAVARTEPLLAQVSGSGGTVFGLYPNESSAFAAGAALAGWEPRLAPVLSRGDSRPDAWEV